MTTLATEAAEITSRRSYHADLSASIGDALRHTGATFIWADDGMSFRIRASRYSYASAIKIANRIAA